MPYISTARRKLKKATIRFAGDSGDGMQLIGNRFFEIAAANKNYVNTFPDYPSEIRAPEGTLYGVSAMQLQFGSVPVYTPGDQIDFLFVTNASALKVNLPRLAPNAVIVANAAGFTEKNLLLAKCQVSPLESGELDDFTVIAVDMPAMVQAANPYSTLKPNSLNRAKNMFMLGVAAGLFNKPLTIAQKWLNRKFKNVPEIRNANLNALQAGYNWAIDAANALPLTELDAADMPTGTYRNITGNEAIALGMVTAARQAKLPLFLGSYPITPATEILHFIASYAHMGVKYLQAEDEIAAITSAIGAAYGGSLALTTTSGPGLSLKAEALGLVHMLELPLVVVNVQRAGPSTGLPTKPEQSDLLFAMFGRHGEAPIPIVAARSTSHCFDMAIEASRLAIKYMTPVILLSDGYLAQGSEPFKVPQPNQLPSIEVSFPEANQKNFLPYGRQPDTLARPWAIPGIPGLQHRIGGLEKADGTGQVSHDPDNHQKMIELRYKKVQRIANDVPPANVRGPANAKLLVLTWGSTFGAAREALDPMWQQNIPVNHLHLDFINPFPAGFKTQLEKYDTILLPEINTGHLAWLIKAQLGIDTIGLNIIEGRPIKSNEIAKSINQLLEKQ